MQVGTTTHGLPAGTRFARYAVVRPMAGGGMSEVYLGVDPQKELGARTPVAIKRLLPHMAWDPVYVRMFLDEVRIAAGLDHPNIVRVLDFGVGEGGHYFAMEYLHGVTGHALLRDASRHGGIPIEVGVRIVMQVAAGLQYAHALDLVHRDVSPSNVMVTHAGAVKLVDFGIARMRAETRYTRAGTLKGKIGYMSPEQCRGENVDQRSDIFGLGILLYELTVGRRAFYGDNDYGVINRIVEGDYRRPQEVIPSYPKALASIVERALAVDPKQRYESAELMAADLRALGFEHSPAATVELMTTFYEQPPQPSLALPVPPRRGVRNLAWVGGAVALGLGSFVAGSVLRASPEPGPARLSPPTIEVASTPGPTVTRTVPTEPDPEPSPASLSSVPALPSPAVEQAPEEVSVVAAPAPRRATKRKRSPRKKRRSKTSEPASSAPKGGPDDSLLPPSWHNE